jgi:hypothetical protein
MLFMCSLVVGDFLVRNVLYTLVLVIGGFMALPVLAIGVMIYLLMNLVVMLWRLPGDVLDAIATRG